MVDIRPERRLRPTRSREFTAAIAAVTVCPPAEDDVEPEYIISPVFVTLTPRITLTDHDRREARPAPRNAAANSISISPPSAGT